MNRGAGWEPSTEAEVALYDALVAGDQEKYFRALGRTELLLPVSADAVAGRSPMGWATWTSNDHTHLLAFTSTESMRTCLAEHAGAARRMSLSELSAAWPNQDWWLAVNPGLPIEGYLPSWFVVQLGKGDARLPGQKSAPRDRLARVEALERAKAARAAAQHPREPVRVSATVAPRALPSAPEPAPAPSIWTESTPVATPWLQPPRAEPPPPPYAAPLPQRPVPPPPTLAEAGAGRFDSAPLPQRPVPQEQPLPQRQVPQEHVALPSRYEAPLPQRVPQEQAAPPSRYEALVPASWPEPVASAPPAPTSPPTRPVAEAPAQPAAAWPSQVPEPTPASTWEEPAPPSTQQTSNGHGMPPERPRHAEPEPDFVPANSVEAQLFEAAEAGNTDAFLSTLLLATVLIPKSSGTTNGQWRPQPIDGEPHLICYTSTQHLEDALETVSIRFIKLISDWPDPSWSFAVNPGTPVGATLPGGQLLALASWAAEVGLGGDDDVEQTKTESGAPAAGRASPELTVLQKAIAPSQVGYYLERGYDRVSGFVHRAHEVGQLRGPDQMRKGLGLHWEGSPFAAGATEMYVLRWSAYRPNLYRIPYGGQHEAGMRAMEGWVIERAPFRGNGFAPGESKEIIAEFKVDSARLPHGARLLRLRPDGSEEIIAVLDSDGQRWLRTDGGS